MSMIKPTNVVPITVAELEDIQKTMITLINSFPELPEQVRQNGIMFEQLKPRSICMCMSTISNPIRLNTYICGSYTAKYPFKLFLQTMSTSDKQRIDSQAILSKIGEWLEGRTIVSSDGNLYRMEDFPKMSDKREITQIYRTTTVKLVERLAPNIEISEAGYAVEYYVQNDF